MVQWIASEKEGRSVVPLWFWYFSLIGGAVSLTYAVHINSQPFIVGQLTGMVVYARNLWLIRRGARPTSPD